MQNKLNPIPYIKMPQKIVALMLTATLALGACGIRGELETPPPVWGDNAEKTEPETPKN